MTTDEQLNIAICELMGWTNIYPSYSGKLYGTSPIGEELTPVPDHITGIEALGNMHEAEKRLTNDQWKSYCIPLGGRDINWTGAKRMLHAEPRDKAIALLRVVKPEIFK